MEKLIGKERYINASNDDLYVNIRLNNTSNLYKEEKLLKEISQYDVMVNERSECNKYLFHGKSEFLFDNLIPYSPEDWDMEVGYPKYMFNVNTSINYIQLDISYIKILNVEVSLYDLLVLNNGEDTIVTKVIKVNKREDGVHIILDTFKDLTGYYLYIDSFEYYREFIPISKMKVYENGFATNIFSDPIHQYIKDEDIDLSDYKGFLGEPLNEIVYRMVYVSKAPNEVVVVNPFSDRLTRGFFNIKDYITTEEYEYEYKLKIRVYKGNKFDEIGLFMNNFKILKLKEYGDTFSGVYYDDLNIPSYAHIFSDGSYFYKEILTHEVTEEMKYVPFMNDKNYYYDDLKFFLRREKPITKYNPLRYTDELDENGIKNMVNPLEKRLC